MRTCCGVDAEVLCHVLFQKSPSLSLSLLPALNLLGLNWRLKPTNGHLVSTGLSTGIPSTGDVATVPSGGRGKNDSHSDPAVRPEMCEG